MTATADPFAETQAMHGSRLVVAHPRDEETPMTWPGDEAEGDFDGVEDVVREEPPTDAPVEQVRLVDLAGLDDKAVPQDLAAETSVFGESLFLAAPQDERATANAEMLDAAFGRLRSAHFYGPYHAAVWRVMGDMWRRDRALDVVLFRNALLGAGLLEKVGGTNFISRIVASAPSAANFGHHVAIVEETALRRDLAVAGELLGRAMRSGERAHRRRAQHELDRAREAMAEFEARGTLKQEGKAPLALTAAALQELWRRGEIKPRAWFLDGLFYKNHVSEIVGPQGGGKSALLWDLATFAASPGPSSIVRWRVAPHPDGRPWRVGLVLAENELGEVVERYTAYFGDTQWPEALHVYELLDLDEPPDIATAEGRAWMEDAVGASGLEVLVLDNLTSLCGGDFIDNSLAKQVMGWLRRFARKRGVTVILGVHTTKSSAGDDLRRNIDKAFGSTFWTTWADSVLALTFEEGAGGRPNEESSRRILRHVKVRGRRQPSLVVDLDDESMRFVEVSELGKANVGPDGVTPKRSTVSLVGFENALQPVGSTHKKNDVMKALGVKSDDKFREHVKRWAEHLGDRLEVGVEAGPHGQKTFRLRPLEERSAEASDGGAA